MNTKNFFDAVLTDPKYVSRPDSVRIMFEGSYATLGGLRKASRAIGKSRLGGNTIKVLLAVLRGHSNVAQLMESLRIDRAPVSQALTKLIKAGAIERTPAGEYKVADAPFMSAFDRPQLKCSFEEFFGRAA